jgi:hypothetical protein
MAQTTRTVINAELTATDTHVETSGVAGNGVNTNGVRAITGAIMNGAINSTVGLLKIAQDISDSSYNLSDDTSDDVTEGATQLFTSAAEKVTWNGKTESGDAITVVLNVTSLSIEYVDHSAVNQTQSVVTGVTVTSAVVA